MEKRPLGRSGLEVSVLTMGCWQAGQKGWVNIEDDDTIAAMRAALDGGINFFDTAEGYGAGYSEEILAKALEGRRDEVLLATKVGAENYTADKLRASCEASLRRLNTDHIDLYQLHWPTGSWDAPVVPVTETLGVLNELKSEGKIRAIGVSNFNAAQIDEAMRYSQIDALQPPYSLFWRSYESNGTIQKCIDENIGVICYSPLAQGLLTGKFNKDNRPKEGDNRAGNTLFKGETFDRALAAVEQLRTIAQRYGKSTGELSLQWLLSQPGMTSAIVGARSAEQVQGNLGAANFKISDTDLQEINRIGRTVTDTLPADRTVMWG
jgi:aryl-alcohol dehydrogenase-like predicted oxidoreductase